MTVFFVEQDYPAGMQPYLQCPSTPPELKRTKQLRVVFSGQYCVRFRKGDDTVGTQRLHTPLTVLRKLILLEMQTNYMGSPCCISKRSSDRLIDCLVLLTSVHSATRDGVEKRHLSFSFRFLPYLPRKPFVHCYFTYYLFSLLPLLLFYFSPASNCGARGGVVVKALGYKPEGRGY
jgi:hypothetical protein